MVRVLIVHGNSILGAGLRMMLTAAPGVEVIGEVDAAGAANASGRLQPDVALIDADSCEAEGLPAARALRERCQNMKIVMLSLRDDPQTRAGAMRAGACSFISKQEPEKILEEIRNRGENSSAVPPCGASERDNPPH
jgi:DNA-binding NarL/FixJ family response regulator